MPLHLPYLILLLVSIQVFIGCQKRSERIRLDHYGEFENTELTIELVNVVDSVHLSIRNNQELFGPWEFDTTMYPDKGNATLDIKITLERPTPLVIRIDSISKEVFLIPDFNNNFRISLGTESSNIFFQDVDLQHINEYYWAKAQIGGDMYMRQIMTKYMTLPTQIEAQDSFHALYHHLLHVLYKSAKESELPDWFTSYEQKELEYFTVMVISSIPLVRTRVFRIQDSIEITPDLKGLHFDPEDEDALVTRSFLESLPHIISDGGTFSEKSDIEPAQRIKLYYEISQNLKNSRIKDVFLSHLFYIMSRSSISYPDSLLAQVKNEISDHMQPYVERIEAKYNQFNGAPAPPIHLKNLQDGFTSLADFRGNLVLLDFWFVGCRFCREELPYTQKLMEEFQDENFKVLQICMQSDQNDWEKLKNDFVGVPLYSNPAWDKKLTNSYKLAGFPRYVLVDENGIILEGWCERPSDPALKQRIENYFGKE